MRGQTVIEPIQAECALAIARSGSFRRAAEEVHLSQPSVSSHIAKLERSLGLTIFDRSSNGAALTVDGAQLVPYLTAFLTAQAVVQREADRFRSGAPTTLSIVSHRIGLAVTLPPALRMLRSTLGPVAVALDFALGRDGAIAVSERRAEIALCFRYVGAPPLQDTLIEELVGISRSVLFVPPGHRLAGRSSIRSEDLAGETMIVLRDARIDRENTLKAMANVDDVAFYSVIDVQQGLDLVAQRVGVMVAADAALPLSPTLVTVPIDLEVVDEMTIVRRRDEELSPAASIVWELVRR